MLIWLYFAARARRWLFFTTVNPVIETGGVFGESKINILQRLPPEVIPTTLFITSETSIATTLQRIREAGLSFPLIAKPNVGERGTLVKKLASPADLADYMARNMVDFIIQEFVTYEEEVSVLHYRLPGASKGGILSLCLKEYLHVTGNGVSTIRSLMENYPRARLQLERLERQNGLDFMERIPASGEVVLLEPIGNHNRGTTFLNGNALIDDRLVQVFDAISFTLEHQVYYGRYDIKCSSLEAVKNGVDFKILELNGVAGEPAHIYDPSYPIWKKYEDIYRCWKVIFSISQEQARRGVKSLSLREGVQRLFQYLRYTKSLKR